jgi:pyridoxal 5'-phosphate synthase pdxT subunit
MATGILALQGAFIEHKRKLEALGEECFEIRQARDLRQPFTRLVLPGGESTTQAKLLRELGLLAPLRNRIIDGMPVLATCAGLILLAERVDGTGDLQNLNTAADAKRMQVQGFGTLPITVRRNAYGRQLGSFHTQECFGQLGMVPMTFIRAPFITEVRQPARVLATCEGNIVAVQSGNQLGMAFHPELDEDNRIHELFLKL